MEIKKLRGNVLPLTKKIKCPNCKNVAQEPFVPFCSKKCASIDLMKWLTDEHQNKINPK